MNANRAATCPTEKSTADVVIFLRIGSSLRHLRDYREGGIDFS